METLKNFFALALVVMWSLMATMILIAVLLWSFRTIAY
jgi:type IV secretory pathway TrbL component